MGCFGGDDQEFPVDFSGFRTNALFNLVKLLLFALSINNLYCNDLRLVTHSIWMIVGLCCEFIDFADRENN